MCKKCNLQKIPPNGLLYVYLTEYAFQLGIKPRIWVPDIEKKCHNFVENMVRIKSEGLRIPNQFRSSGTFLKTMAGNI